MDWRESLVAWYHRSARDLPWRATRDPWAVLVSETMLQQTRVETVLPRYPAFLTRFPTAASLASAREEDVLALWAGLGYYRRARNLRAAAAVIAQAGSPTDVAGWEELPGVGAYTARAIAAIALRERVLAVDGNVDRVVSRLLFLDDVSAATRRRRIEAAVEPPDDPGAFQQALFDLGATVCLPRAPRCGECPVSQACAARASGREREVPPRAARKAVPLVHVAAALDATPRGLRLVRHSGEFLSGLWGLPHAEGGSARAARRKLAASFEIAQKATRTYRHAFSMKTWEVAVYAARRPSRGRRFASEALPPMPTAWTKALAAPKARAPSSQPRRRSP